MAPAEEVNPLHSSYQTLSARYRAAWTYHQLLEGLHKFFGNQDLVGAPIDFQALFGSLKDVSGKLNEPDAQRHIAALDRIRGELDDLLKSLGRLDRKVEVSQLRHFFQHSRKPVERALLDLVRFYQDVQRDRSWAEDRLDKVDFLLTRLGETVLGADDTGDRRRLEKILATIAGGPTAGRPADPGIVARRRAIEAARDQIEGVQDFEELTRRELVSHYRDVKHGLGSLLLNGEILPLIVETNLALRWRVRDFTRREKERILLDYETVSRLEREGSLASQAQDVASLHHLVGQFRERARGGDVRLEDVAEIRKAVQTILQRLAEESDDDGAGERGESGGGDVPAAIVDPAWKDKVEEGAGARPARRIGDRKPPAPSATGPADAQTSPGSSEPVSMAGMLSEPEEQTLLGTELKDLLDRLEQCTRAGEDLTTASGLAFYRLERREATAFTRLREGLAVDEQLERFVLAAAALRRRINVEVEEIRILLADSISWVPVRGQTAASVLRLADWYVRRFTHLREMLLVEADGSGAAQLDRLRMHLMRDYAGLWLLANPERQPATINAPDGRRGQVDDGSETVWDAVEAPPFPELDLESE